MVYRASSMFVCKLTCVHSMLQVCASTNYSSRIRVYISMYVWFNTKGTNKSRHINCFRVYIYNILFAYKSVMFMNLFVSHMHDVGVVADNKYIFIDRLSSRMCAEKSKCQQKFDVHCSWIGNYFERKYIFVNGEKYIKYWLQCVCICFLSYWKLWVVVQGAIAPMKTEFHQNPQRKQLVQFAI